MKKEVIEEMEDIVGSDWVIKDLDQMQDYLFDETPVPSRPKSTDDVIVVKPSDMEEISQIVKYANEAEFPIIPRGAGTGLCGAAIPTKSCIILSMERLDEIIEVDQDNFTVTCQAGVPLEKLYERLDETESLFFPPHPGDEGAHIGGLVVENAGGARAVKYGIIRNFVKGLEVVLPTGEIIKLGGKILKNNTGFDLMNLMIGSEGILGIIGKVTLRLYIEPSETVTLIVPYEERHDAINTVPEMLRQGVTPLSVEYMERDLIEESADHIGKEWPIEEGNAYLYIIVSGEDEDQIYRQCEEIGEICQENGAIDVLIAERSERQQKILDIRSNIYTALEPHSADILDVTVPPAEVGNLMDEIDEIAEKYDTKIPAYGHVADGNLHPHIMTTDGEAPDYLEEVKEEVYQKALDLGGVITGEHGIGKTRVKNLPQALNEKHIEILKGIKRVFDPKNIMNPGTVVELDE